MKPLVRILPLLVSVSAFSARADVIVGPYSFANTALIDGVVQVEGPTWANGWLDGTDSHPYLYTFEQLVASQWDDIVLLGATDVGSDMVFEAAFANNVLVNGPGPDLIMFDAAEPSGYSIAFASSGGYTPYRDYAPPVIDIGVEHPYWWWGPNGVGLVWLKVWAIEIDLSSFGFAEGYVVTAFRFRGDEGADPLGAAALHTEAPLPTNEITWGAIKALYR
jgi:hypothetical protein